MRGSIKNRLAIVYPIALKRGQDWMKSFLVSPSCHNKHKKDQEIVWASFSPEDICMEACDGVDGLGLA
jgi:hypothetical protein